MDKYNKARKFNSGPVPRLNELWVARALGMQINPNSGPDLIDENKIVEVKFTLSHNSKNYFKWSVLGYQINYYQLAQSSFWALGFYDLELPVQKIKTKDPEKLEKLIIQREVNIVSWDWIHQFKPKKCVGKTEKSSWDYELISALYNKIPKVIKTYKVEKGLVHITEGVPENTFSLLN